MYKILSLDGGGLRGLITARLLQRLNDHPQIKGFLNEVDMVTGTSTGGILALGLASGKTPAQICSLYKDKGKLIFCDSVFDDICDFGTLLGADYSSKPLKQELSNIFGNLTLSELTKKVAIPTFDLDNEEQGDDRTWKPKIFHNFSGVDADMMVKVADVALYTSSAPTFFPSADGYIDGGVFANNPSMIGIAQVISHTNIEWEASELKDISLLSVGTGINNDYITGDRDWGAIQWIKPLINILVDGVSGVADYQSKQLLGDRYNRLQINLGKEKIAMDAVKMLDRMDEIATTHDISNTVAWIDKHFNC